MTDESYCIYCQREFGTARRLVNHLKESHHGTYAYWNLVPEDERGDDQ